MREKAVYPLIFLPGPVLGAHSVTVSSSSSTWAGDDIDISVTFQGDGTGLEQVLDYLQAHYSEWHAYLGADISIDFGKGPLHRVFDERFGVYEWADSYRKHRSYDERFGA